MMRSLARLILLALAGLIVFFAVLNRHMVLLKLPFTEHGLVMPLFFVFAAGLVFGLCLAMLLGIGPAFSRYRARRAAERRALTAETALMESRELEAEARRQATQQAIDRAQAGNRPLPVRQA